jgi:hypothetical protein
MVGIGINITSGGGYDVNAVFTADVLSRVAQTGAEALLVNACNAGGVDVLSSVYAFQDFNDFLAKGTPASTSYALLLTQQLQRGGFYGLASLVQPCVNGDAGNLFTLKP